jgi:CheY-like chemotaxis protein
MSTQQLKALVVDDDSIVRRMLVFALGKEEFACSQAADGVEALAKLHGERFDLLVTDLQMPGKHGHALAVEILAGENRPVIVVHSSLDDPRLVKDLMARGVDDFIQKPTNYGAFAAKIKAVIQRRKSESQDGGTGSSRPDPQLGTTSAPERIEKPAGIAGKAGASPVSAESESGHAGIGHGGPQSPLTPETALILESEMLEVLQGGHLKPAAPATVERRSVERQPYLKTELLAACSPGELPSPSMFREVVCHEICTTGISFFLPRPPGFQLAVITLGKSTDKISMLIRVVHCTEHDDTGHQRYLVGGQFERRVSSRELRGGHPAVHAV